MVDDSKIRTIFGKVSFPTLGDGVVILASLFVDRPFCKYTYPYGAVLGVFNLLRVFKLKRHISMCIDYKDCDRTCPMNIEVSTGKIIRDHQCISWFEVHVRGYLSPRGYGSNDERKAIPQSVKGI